MPKIGYALLCNRGRVVVGQSMVISYSFPAHHQVNKHNTIWQQWKNAINSKNIKGY